MDNTVFSKNFDELLGKIDFSKLGKNIAVKMHFGEKGCTTYMPPIIVKKLYEKVKKDDNIVELVDCNALYKGSRTNSYNHIETAKSHGFIFAPVKILDGEIGEEYVEINGCKIGRNINDYDSLIVLTHFKGHIMTGFGGALKNVGMGLGSRAGKLDMHSNIKPSVNVKKCAGCGLCAKNCPALAISVDTKAFINPKKCIGCATCIEVCPNNAISIPWNSKTHVELQERICDYAKAVLSLFKNVIFINALINITKDCDCIGRKQEKLTKDIGYLYSDNIISIDTASKKLIDKEKILTEKSKSFSHFLEYAKKIGL
ncbi:Ferredoxin [Candidatus Tiddalikarchaeum anstoanum]|nr:Ferredoxin [Candidatus Tiddalikarchaeum anstoanum]